MNRLIRLIAAIAIGYPILTWAGYDVDSSQGNVVAQIVVRIAFYSAVVGLLELLWAIPVEVDKRGHR